MAKKWSDVAASPAFQALSFDEQEAARRQYFEEVVAPRVPTEDLDLARSQFLTQTALRRPANDPVAGTDFVDAATAMQGTMPAPTGERGLIQRIGDFFRPEYKGVMEGYRATPQEQQAEIDRRLSYGAGPISSETVRQADAVRSSRGTQAPIAPQSRQVEQVVQKMDERGERSFGDLMAIANREKDLKRIEDELEAEGRQRFAKENPILGSIAAGSAGLVSGAINIPSVAADAFNQIAVNPVLRALGMQELPRAPTAFGTEYLGKAASDYMPKIGKQEMSVAIARDEFAPWLMSKLAANSPQIAQSLLAAFVPPLRAVLLPGMAGTAAGQSFVEGDDSRVALAKGGVEYVSEKLPLGVFDKVGDVLKGMSPAKANTVLAVAGQRMLQAGGAVTANTLTNAVEEVAAQLGGNVLDKYFQGKDIELSKGLAEAAVIGGATGKLMSVPQAGAALTGYYEPERQIAREIDAAGLAFDAVGDVGSQAISIDMLRTEPGSSNLISPTATVANFTPAGSPTKQAGMVDIEVPLPNTPPALPAIDPSIEQQFGLDKLRMGGSNVGTAGVPGGLAAGSGGAGSDLLAGGVAAAGRGAADTAGLQEGVAGGLRADDRSAVPAGGEAGQPAAGVAPAKIWAGRAGDGYATEADANQALPGLQRKNPTLDWTLQRNADGKFIWSGIPKEATLGSETAQAVQTQAQGVQAQGAGAVAAQAEPATAAIELSDSERAGLKLALPAPAKTFTAVQEQLATRRGVTVEPVPAAELSDPQRVASAVARLMGNTLTVVRATSGNTANVPNGFINRLGGKHIFVDANANDAPVSIALHEGLHGLPADKRKALNSALLEVFNQDQRDEFLREFNYTADKFDEEAPAMMAQAISKRADFWEQLRDKMGNREFGEVAKVILSKLNQVITGARDQYGDAFVSKYIKDVVKARDLLTTAYAEAMQAQGFKPDAELVDVAASNRAEQKNAAASRIDDVSADRFKRTPALQQALQDLQEGKITRAEYSKVVDEARPVYPYKELPEITTEERARFALANGRGQSAEKAAKYGLPAKELQPGEMVQLRLDIPSYQEHDAWVVTVHRPKTTNRSVQAAYDAGPTVGYESVASITNATFGMRQSSALKIAQGTSKGTIATVLGEWKPITTAEAKTKAQAAMKSKDWTQVGMDPFRHSYFYDRDTMRPVVAADEVIQVGPLVLAKNAKFDDELDVTGAPLMFSEKAAKPKKVGEFTYTEDARGGITVTGDAERIKFLTRKVTNAKVNEDGTVSFGPKFAKDALDALRSAPKVDPKIAAEIREKLGLSEQELASTSLEYQTGKPKDLAFVAPLQGGIPETVRFLEERRRASGLRLLDIANPEDQDTLAKLIAAETLAAIRSSGNALEWYDETIAKTLAMAAVKYPELANDANAQMVFRLAMAITSQGLNVENNLKFTMRQYDAFRRTGRYPEVGEGDSSQAMVSNFKLANELMDEMGQDLFRRFLVTPFTIGELNSAGFEPGGELVDETVLGSSVFGPKIGFGFYSNLNGNFEPVTMDMWFMRTIGRLIGRLRSFDAEKFGGQLQRFRGAFDERGTDGVYGDRFDADLIERARTDQDAAIELARQVKKAHERDYKENRAAFDAKTRKKSDLVLAAETMIQSVDKPKDVPGNGTERRQLREVVRKAVSEVERVYGQRIPPAAMQALIWYPEQELYKAMGVKLSVTSQDYAGATEKVLTEEGYDAKRLRTAAQSGARRVRQANARDVGRAAQGDGQEARRSGPLQAGERDEFLRTRYERTELAKERLDPKRKGIVFEVAPDPNNERLTNAWRTLSQEQRLAISERVARTIVPRVLGEFNTDGIISAQVGSYLDDTNPSFSLLLNKGDVLDVSKMLGFVLAQDSMMVVSPKPFKGGDANSALVIEVGDKTPAEIDEIYNKLREIRVNGEQPIGGQSYANGGMTVLNFSNVPTSQLAILVDQKLNKAYSILTRDVYAAFPEKKDYDYASATDDGRGSRAVLRQRARDLRAEATSALEAELRDEGIEFSNKADRAEGARQEERVTDLEPEDVLQPETIAAAEAAIAKYKQPDKPDPLTKEQRLKGEILLQPMFEAARRNKPEFDDNLRRIAEEVGGFAKTPGIKKPMRAVTKLVTEMNGNASKMKDLLRGTIVVGSNEAAQAAIDKIGEVYTFDRIKNRMGAEIVSPDGSVVVPETMPTGYQDILTNVVLADGTVAEIQLTTPEMAAAKHLGHEVYAFEREMPAGAVKDEMVALQVRIYSEGRAAFDARQATQSSYSDSNTSLETSPAFSRTSEGLRGEGSGVQAVAEDMSAGVVTGTSSQSKNRVPSGSLEKSNAIGTSEPSITKLMPGEVEFSNRARESWVVGRDELGRATFGAGGKAYRYAADVANLVLDKLALKPISTDLSRAMRQMKVEIAKAQELTVDVAAKLGELSQQEREMISDIIEGELKRGSRPPQRVLQLAASMQSIMSEQTAELVRLGMLSPEAAGRWDGKYLPRFYESKLKNEVSAWAKAVKQLVGRKRVMQGIGGSSLKGRGKFQTIPVEELEAWLAEGWEERDPDFDPETDTEITVWRDYTRQERDDMGEIRDAMFRFVMGYNKSQRDISLGRLYENIADTVASRTEKPGFVQVPRTNVEDTYAKRYGKLAGMWVPKEVLDHLSSFDESMQNDLLRMYLKGMSLWKEGKTVLNPVSHANNILSNLTMAHFAGVSYWDAQKYIGATRDLVKNSPMVQEAKDAGLFLGTMTQAEMVQLLPDQLKVLAAKSESKAGQAVEGVWNALSFFLRKPFGKAYEAEDLFFRYLIYRDARQRGVAPADAVDYAQKFIFTYDDLPKTARAIRNFALPFFAYTYKVIPALAQTALQYPWRFAAPAAALYTVNAVMYAMAAGGEDEDWLDIIKRYLTDESFREEARRLEESERPNLPEWMKGYSLTLGTAKAIRLGMDEATGLPVFLDVSRIFPGGDLFDAVNNAGGVPLLAPITPNNPVLNTAYAMLANKDTFRGKDLVKESDTDGEAAAKRAEWIWKQFTPAIAVGNTHFERAMNVLANQVGEPINLGIAEYTGLNRQGQPVQTSYAAMQTVGIKAMPIDLELSAQIREAETRKLIREIEAEMRSIRRLERKGVISSETADLKLEQQRGKRQRLKDGLTVDGEERN